MNLFFYLTTILIWGSTWLAIKFQLGMVDPMVSVAYRFGLASLLLLLFCRASGRCLRFSRTEHACMALQGLLLFSINYWLFYVAEETLASGLVAVVFSTMVVLNLLNAALFLGAAIEARVVGGALLGLGGIVLVFAPELSGFDRSGGLAGLFVCLAATVSASLGNIVSARNQRHRLPVLQTNAFGMGYGALLMALVALASGKEFRFDPSLAYVGSLLYLALFGSIVAFGCYLTLVGRIGAGRAAYATLIFPLVALSISTCFEGYHWSATALVGVLLILGGNLLALRRPAAVPRAPADCPGAVAIAVAERL